MAQSKPPVDNAILKHLEELNRDMKEMENAIVALRQMPKNSEDCKRALEKLRKDQKQMAKKLEALRRFDIKAKEELSDLMLSAIRLLGTLNLNPEIEQESSDASVVNTPPPSMTFIRRWTLDKLGLDMAETEAEAAREDLQIELAEDDDNTAGSGKTEKTESSDPERTEDAAKGG